MAPAHVTDSALMAFEETALQNTYATPAADQDRNDDVQRLFAQPGARIKHYEVIRKLGEGGMGAVYLARDTRLGRRVAIKFLHEQSGPALERFLVEARATALCQHENIVVIYDVGEVEGYPYMVLEYIEGRTLRAAMHERLKNHSEDNPAAIWAIELILPVVRALSGAHAMNIVHRDLKPENILLANNGLVKVVDFGIAKQVGTPMAGTNPEAQVEGLGNAHLTQAGATPGTMMYMAPEQWLSDEIDGRTDIWAAGLILFELLVGQHPLAPVTMDALTQVIRFDASMPRVKERRPDAADLGEIIDRCLRKRKTERYGSADELYMDLHALLVDRRAPIRSEQQCPFAGLSAFQESDADRYFGREQDIAAVTSKLRNQELVAMVGPSGAGKSSFIRAGLIPAIKNADRNLETCIVRPGRKPLAALVDALSFLVDTAGDDECINPAEIEQNLLSEPGYLGVRLRARCRRKGAGHRILLFIDQFEELYTLGIEPRLRHAFCASLLGVADDASSPLRVILSMRADFLDRLAEDQSFLSAVTRGLYFLPPLAADRLRDVLTKPVERVRHRFEDEALIEEILGGLVGMKSPLPILQFLATKLWETRDQSQRLLTKAAYRLLGGVAGALSTHADAVLAAMSTDDQKITSAVFLRLVTPERTRAVVLFDELCVLSEDNVAIETIVQRLSEARLLTIDVGDERTGKTVELVHESLIERWGKLRTWLDENELDAPFLVELRGAAAQWEKNGRAPGFLWRDEAAQKAETWSVARNAAGRMELGPRELAYLNAVVRLAERTRKRRRWLLAASFAGTISIAVVVGMLAIAARNQAERADKQAERARSEALQARNATRIAAARELQKKDPTKAFSLLREIEPGPIPRGWVELVLQTRYAGVAETVRYHRRAVLGAALSQDGRRIASNLSDMTIEIWNVDGTGDPVVLRGHNDKAFSIAWSHDGRRIATGSRDKTIRIWNADGSGAPVVLTGHESAVRSVWWSSDDQRVVSTSYKGSVRIFKTDGTQEHVIVGKNAGLECTAVDWSPDMKRLAIGVYDGTVQIWDAAGTAAEMVLRGHEGVVEEVAWSPDGQRIASASRDKTVRIWNTSGTGEPIVLRGHQNQVGYVRWSPDGQWVLSGSDDKTARLWNIRQPGASVVLRGHDERISSIAWSLNGRRILSSSLDREVRLWNADDLRKSISLVGHTAVVKQASFGADGTRIVSASIDDTVRIWNLQDNDASQVLRGHEKDVHTAYFSLDGRKVVSASKDKTVRVWPTDGTGEPVVLRGHEDEVLDASFTPDARHIVSSSSDKTIRIWDVDGQKAPVVLRGHESDVGAVAISPDGQRLVSASHDKTLRLWRIDGIGEPIVFRAADQHGVWSVGWSPDGKRIVSGNDDWFLRIWNADGTGTPLVFGGHRALSTVHGSGAFSPDGRRFVSSSDDGTIRIWNSDGSGDSVVLYVGDARINSASWSADGKHIVAALENNTIVVWRDVEIIEDANDHRLWRMTNACLPLDARQRMLGFPETQMRADVENCSRRVANAFEGSTRGL